MFSSTLWPGSWPPSPGLAPCAILICRSSALTRYSAVTPKRPDATCLIAERIESPLGSGLKRSVSSPPSPVFDLPPMRFMAMASVVCASRLIEPKLIAPVAKRLTMSAAGSTSSSGIGCLGPLELHQAADGQQPLALLVDRCRRRPCTRPAELPRTACCSLADAVRRPGMVLAAQAEGVVAADIEHGAVDRVVAVGVAVAAHRLLGDLVPARRPRWWWRCR